MIFSERDVAALRLLYWCQYVQEPDIKKVISETELENLIALKLVKHHKSSGALMLSTAGKTFLIRIQSEDFQDAVQSYHSHVVLRKIRVSKLVITAYRAFVNVFSTDVQSDPAMILSSHTRVSGHNPWGSTRIASVANLGNTLYAVHYVCPGIGKLALTDELTAFTNQTARFRNARRAFLFAGESYPDILAELEQSNKTDTKLRNL